MALSLEWWNITYLGNKSMENTSILRRLISSLSPPKILILLYFWHLHLSFTKQNFRISKLRFIQIKPICSFAKSEEIFDNIFRINALVKRSALL